MTTRYLGRQAYKIIKTKAPVSVLLLTLGATGFLSAQSSDRSAPPAPTSTRIALLLTPENGSDTFLHIVELGRPIPPPVSTLRHLPNAAIKGTVLPTGAVAVIADNEPGRDRSFGSALFLLTADRKVQLSDRIVYASKPVASPDGKIYVERGLAGSTEPSSSHFRVDSLTIDEIDPETGATRTVWATKGYAVYLAGLFETSLILYDVGPARARLLLVDRETGREKPLLASMPAFATDFSITSDGKLLFQNRDPKAELWTIEQVDLVTGKQDRIAATTSSRLAPQAWPNGSITWNTPQGLRSQSLSLSATVPGILKIEAFSADRTMATGYFLDEAAQEYSIVLLNNKGAVVARTLPPPRTSFWVAGFAR